MAMDCIRLDTNYSAICCLAICCFFFNASELTDQSLHIHDVCWLLMRELPSFAVHVNYTRRYSQGSDYLKLTGSCLLSVTALDFPIRSFVFALCFVNDGDINGTSFVYQFTTPSLVA